jgi:PKD repeat protein
VNLSNRHIIFIIILLVNFHLGAQSLSIIWPKSNEVISDRTPLFIWNGVEGISNYQISLSLDSTFNVGVQQFSSSTTSYQLISNLSSGTWYWKVNTNVNGQNLISNLGKFQVFEPTDFLNIGLWLRSDSVQVVNGKVTQWYDRSGNNNHCSQGVVSSQPEYISNDIRILKPAIKLDGTDDLLTGSTISNLNNSSLSLFIVQSGEAQIASVVAGLFNVSNSSIGLALGRRFYDGSNHLVVGNNGSSLLSSNGNLPSAGYNYKITGYRKNFGIQTELHLNSVSLASSTNSVLNGTFTNGNYILGNYPDWSNFKGSYSEVLLFQENLSSQQQSLVNTYLMDRYAPPVNLGADIQANGFCNLTLQPTAQIYTSYLWNTNATTPTISINNPGTYWLQTVDIFGRTSRDTIQVYRPVYDSIQLISMIFCFNENSTINAYVPVGANFVQWSDGLTNQTRVLNSTQTLSYTVTDNNNCQRTSNVATFAIDASLQNITLGTDTSLCSGNIIQLQNPPADITAYTWNTGNTQSIQPVDTTGQYILDVTNINNCQNRDTIEVTVIGTSPTLQFAFSDTLCQFSQGSFVDTSFVTNSNGTISSKTWFISIGDTLNGSSGSFSIDSSGTFNVTLLVQTQEGCSSTTTFPLIVHPKPIVSFTTQNYCPYEEIELTPQNSTFYILNSTFWNFDDNTTSTSPNPSHVFGTTDTYNVSLQAQDINGCRDTVVQVVYIQPAPVADFSFTNTCELSAVNFVNNSSITDTFSLSMSQWTYGDGTQATNPSIQKVYQSYGEYDVQLVVTANNGCQDTLSQTITIHPKPILGWQVGPACKNTWTTFENQSAIPLGSVTQTDWLVNLQYPLEGTSSAYKFVTTGVQYLNLTSTSDQGCTTDTLIIVNVQSEINAAYSVSPTTVVAGVPVIFTNSSSGDSQLFEWNLGNGNIMQTTVLESIEATGFASSFIGDSILTYLAIQNTIGCKDTAYQYVKVNEPRIDLAINQLFVQDINGFYKVGVELRNLGFVEITQTDLLLKLYNSSPILETETESLAPGESRMYLFNANPSAFVSTQDKEISYLCVEANSYNDYQLIETELRNNIYCLNTEGGNFVLLPIYPNPTNDDITYTLIVSEESTITTSLTDETGRIVQSSTELFASGLHTSTLSMRNLSAGVYYFHISDGVTSKTVKVLKN